MAKRNDGQQSGNASVTGGTTSGPTADTVEQKVVAFAEQLGRIVGTVQAKAEGWMDRDALSAQISHVRDSAADLLQQLGGGATGNAGPAPSRSKAKAAPMAAPRKASAAMPAASAKAKGRSGGVVDAPGKRHRKPLPKTTGATGSRMASAADAKVGRLKIANASNRRGRG